MSVVVGIGAWTPLGRGWQRLGAAVEAGDLTPGEVALPRPSGPKEGRARAMMSRSAVLAHLALADAIEGIADREHLGAWLGVGGSTGELGQVERMLARCTDGGFDVRAFGEAGLKACNPLYAFQLMNNFTLCHGAILEGVAGPNGTFASRGHGTVVALGEALAALAEGACERAVVGGADSAVHPVAATELRRRWPGRAIVPGEGAAVLALAAEGEGIGVVEVDAEGGADLVAVLAPTAAETAELAAWAADRWPAARCVDLQAALGETLAAGPALAWATVLSALGRGQRGVAVTRDVDGQQAIVALRRAERGAVTRRERPARRAVVTGVGVVSPFGGGREGFWTGLGSGETAVRPIRSFDAETFPTRVAAEVPTDADAGWLAGRGVPEDLGATWARRGWLRDRRVPFGVAAALEACPDGVDADVPLVLAVGLEWALLADLVPILVDGKLDWAREPSVPADTTRVRTLVDLPALAIAEALGLRRPPIVHVSACAAGAMAIAHGAALIERGADVVLCGGTDSMVNPLGLGGMARLGAPSPRMAADACRPFDRHRDGLVIGEGAAMLVLEAEERAGDRGLARIVGWGTSQDAYAASAPRPDGTAAARAIATALRGLDPGRLGWVNAHGTGTPLNDPTEVKALRLALGAAAERCVVSSIKAAIGHGMAAAGALELAATVLALSRGFVPGTATLRELDPACDLDVLGPEGRRVEVDLALSTSFGFGGQNAAVGVERC